MAKYYIGSTTSARVPASKRKRDHDYATASELPLSQALEADFSACGPKYAQRRYNITFWVRQRNAR